MSIDLMIHFPAFLYLGFDPRFNRQVAERLRAKRWCGKKKKCAKPEIQIPPGTNKGGYGNDHCLSCGWKVRVIFKYIYIIWQSVWCDWWFSQLIFIQSKEWNSDWRGCFINVIQWQLWLTDWLNEQSIQSSFFFTIVIIKDCGVLSSNLINWYHWWKLKPMSVVNQVLFILTSPVNQLSVILTSQVNQCVTCQSFSLLKSISCHSFWSLQSAPFLRIKMVTGNEGKQDPTRWLDSAWRFLDASL